MTQHTYEFFPYPESKEAKKLAKENPEAVKCPRCRNHHLDWDNHDKLCERCCNSLTAIHPNHPSLPFIRFARIRGLSMRLVSMMELSPKKVWFAAEDLPKVVTVLGDLAITGYGACVSLRWCLSATRTAVSELAEGRGLERVMLTVSHQEKLVVVSIKEAQNLALVEVGCKLVGAEMLPTEVTERLDKTHRNRKGAYRLKSADL